MTNVGTPFSWAIFKTGASALFETTRLTATLGLCLKYSIIFFAFEPVPEAKMAICRFINLKLTTKTLVP